MASIEELVADSKVKRIERTHRVPVHRLTGQATELLPPGSGLLVVASENSDLFEELAHALERNDTAGIDAVTVRNKQGVANLRAISNEQAIDVMRAAHAFADLHFGTKLLVINAFPVNNVGFTRVLFPYIGGEFDPSLFQLTEYAIPKTDERLQALVVVHEPPLSSRERAVIRQLPAESKGMLFGPASPLMLTPAALFATVTAGLIVVGAGTALGHCKIHFDGIGPLTLPETLEQNPSLAVGQLLEARRQVLTQSSI